jgi:acetyltransferase-like isoleucine patch superfamily enzyme
MRKIGREVKIHKTAAIRVGELVLEDYVTIGPNFKALVSGKLIVRRCSTILHDVSFTGREIELGMFSYVRENVTIGGGQSTGPHSVVRVGDGCLICENVLINDAMEVTIGDEVGIGKEVDSWTHAGFLSVFSGYPCTRDRVKIGNHVWIPSRTSVLPGVTIGDHVIIGNHSLVNTDIPRGCFAGGVPAKILRRNCFPAKLGRREKIQRIRALSREYLALARFKGFTAKIKMNGVRLRFGEYTVFDFESMRIQGPMNDYSEDFRDFLRRNGIKFFTERPFKSIVPTQFGFE